MGLKNVNLSKHVEEFGSFIETGFRLPPDPLLRVFYQHALT